MSIHQKLKGLIPSNSPANFPFNNQIHHNHGVVHLQLSGHLLRVRHHFLFTSASSEGGAERQQCEGLTHLSIVSWGREGLPERRTLASTLKNTSARTAGVETQRSVCMSTISPIFTAPHKQRAGEMRAGCQMTASQRAAPE